MTVCIVGICASVNGNAKTAIAIADRMVTAGDTEFEQTAFSKICKLTANSIAVTAGHALIPNELFQLIRSKFSGIPTPSISAMVKELKKNFAAMRLQRADEQYFRPIGLSVNYFIEKQRLLDSALVIELGNRLEKASLGGRSGLRILIAGIDGDGGHIHCIYDPGVSECFDSIGYCAIGSGERHAENTLIVNDYNITVPLNKAIYLLYEAKKRAELAPGVGRRFTDIAYVDNHGIHEVSNEQITALQRVFDKHDDEEEKCRKDMDKLIKSLPFEGKEESDDKNREGTGDI